jgi:hypothetical protein
MREFSVLKVVFHYNNARQTNWKKNLKKQINLYHFLVRHEEEEEENDFE